jgi:hypothetical protein
MVLGVLLILQYGLFRQYALREVVWAHPTAHDQSGYLTAAYGTYEQILEKGWLEGLSFGYDRVSTGVVYHLQACLLFAFLGANRLAALTLNFAYFALLQIVLIGTLRWWSGRWSLALLGLGLLLTALSPFFWAGGLMDFRMDLGAMCLYGILICLAVRSSLFASRRWSLVVAAAACYLILFRFITVVYLAGVIAPFAAYVVWRLWQLRHDPAAREVQKRRLTGLALACGVVLMIAGPVLWERRAVIKAYYVVGHLTGPEKDIRRQETGDPPDYYLRSLAFNHTGRDFLSLTSLIVCVATVLGMRRGSDDSRRARRLVRWLMSAFLVATGLTAAGLLEASQGKPLHFWTGSFLAGVALVGWLLPAIGRSGRETSPRRDARLTTFFLLGSFLVPLGVLTLNAAKSPVVGDILVPPLIWLILWGVVLSARPDRLGESSPWARPALSGLAAIAFLIGCGMQFTHYTQRWALTERRADAEEVLRLHDLILDACQQYGWEEPTIAYTCTKDFLGPPVTTVLGYERHGVLRQVKTKLCSIFAVTEAEALKAVKASDLVIVSPAERSTFPFDHDMLAIIPRVVDYCDQNMVRLRTTRIFDDEVILFARTAIRTTGGSGGWITSEGLRFDLEGLALQSTRIELRGRANWQWLGKVPGAQAVLTLPRHSPQELPATVTRDGDSYTVNISLPKLDVPLETKASIRLHFDTYFVPRDLGINEDTRQLVLRMPEETSLAR